MMRAVAADKYPTPYIQTMTEQELIDRIRSLRTQLGLTQAEVAEKLNVSRATLAQIEIGLRTLKAMDIIQLAHIFQISVGELLDPKKAPQVKLERGDSSRVSRVKEPAVRISVPQKNLKKFKEVLVYILNQVGSRPNIGETVVYKLLYFIDFDYYEKYEEQLVGATYIKNHFGPTPVEFKTIVERMIGDGDIVRVKSEYFKHPQTKYLPTRDPDLGVLSARELEMINEVLDRLAHMNATQISEYSHGDVPWISTADGKPIDYESVFYRTRAYSVRDDDAEED